MKNLNLSLLKAMLLLFVSGCYQHPVDESMRSNKASSARQSSFISSNALQPIPGIPPCEYPLPTDVTLPLFNYVPASWHQKIFYAPMDPLWAVANLKHTNGESIRGYNFFLIPSPGSGSQTSNHFNPLSSYFQTFFGMYNVINASDGSSYGFQGNTIDASKFLAIALADQAGWLANFAGVPLANLVAKPASTPSVISSWDYNRGDVWTIRAKIKSNVDVGFYNIGFNGNNNVDVFPYCANNGLFSSPSTLWQNKKPWLNTNGYNVVAFDVVITVWRTSNQVNVIYYNGYVDPNLNTSTLTELEPEFQDMANAVVVDGVDVM